MLNKQDYESLVLMFEQIVEESGKPAVSVKLINRVLKLSTDPFVFSQENAHKKFPAIKSWGKECELLGCSNEITGLEDATLDAVMNVICKQCVRAGRGVFEGPGPTLLKQPVQTCVVTTCKRRFTLTPDTPKDEDGEYWCDNCLDGLPTNAIARFTTQINDEAWDGEDEEGPPLLRFNRNKQGERC